jgi:hypothetical protein
LDLTPRLICMELNGAAVEVAGISALVVEALGIPATE